MIRWLPAALAVAAACAAPAASALDFALNPSVPRVAAPLDLVVREEPACSSVFPDVGIARAGTDLEVRAFLQDHCIPGQPGGERTIALGTLPPGVARVVVFACAGNAPPGSDPCTTAVVAVAQGVAPAGVPAVDPVANATLALGMLALGLGAVRSVPRG